MDQVPFRPSRVDAPIVHRIKDSLPTEHDRRCFMKFVMDSDEYDLINQAGIERNHQQFDQRMLALIETLPELEEYMKDMGPYVVVDNRKTYTTRMADIERALNDAVAEDFLPENRALLENDAETARQAALKELIRGYRSFFRAHIPLTEENKERFDDILDAYEFFVSVSAYRFRVELTELLRQAFNCDATLGLYYGQNYWFYVHADDGTKTVFISL